jgi:hypothetical protein
MRYASVVIQLDYTRFDYIASIFIPQGIDLLPSVIYVYFLIVRNSPSACKRSVHKFVCTTVAEVSLHSKLLILTEVFAVDLGSCLCWEKPAVL